jgi:hypothetical protein
MGLFSDYVEQAREGRPHHWLWRDPVPHVESNDRPLPASPPRVFKCAACRAEFTNNGQLRRHIAATHGRRFTYVLLDDRVAQRIELIDRRPDILKIVVGHEPIRAELTVGFSKTTTLTLSLGENDLLPHLPQGFIGTLHISFAIDGVGHDYHFAIGETPSFRTDALSETISRLQIDLDRGDTPDWSRYKADGEALSPNRFEKRFLDGFLEYSLGFDMEKRGRWDHSASHLETALHLLEPFGTRMAVTAKRVLGVRLNCFSILRRCEPTSRFHLARLFFLDNSSAADNLSQAGVAIPTTENAVYCDGLTERLLAILKAFYARDLHNVIVPCQQLRHEPAAQDRNNSDKLDVMMARASHLGGDRAAARLYYSRVQDHPNFAQEAATYIRNPL